MRRFRPRCGVAWFPECGHSNDAIVWIDVKKVDAGWRRDDGYINPRFLGFSGGSISKYLANARRLAALRCAPASHIGWHRGRIGFTDGRHRFAWMRDAGCKILPVTTSSSEALELARRCGARVRMPIVHREIWKLRIRRFVRERFSSAFGQALLKLMPRKKLAVMGSNLPALRPIWLPPEGAEVPLFDPANELVTTIYRK